MDVLAQGCCLKGLKPLHRISSIFYFLFIYLSIYLFIFFFFDKGDNVCDSQVAFLHTKSWKYI